MSIRACGLLFAATLLTGCSVTTIGLPAERPSSSAPDIRSNALPQVGDCVGEDGQERSAELWVTNCAGPSAIARVTRLVQAGGSDACLKDDYTGFDFQASRPSLCLMVYGKEGDCYSEFDHRSANGPRVACSAQNAVVKVKRILGTHDPHACRTVSRPDDPRAASLFYSSVPDFDANPSNVRDQMFCLTSPNL